jgi:hypothetical protein
LLFEIKKRKKRKIKTMNALFRICLVWYYAFPLFFQDLINCQHPEDPLTSTIRRADSSIGYNLDLSLINAKDSDMTSENNQRLLNMSATLPYIPIKKVNNSDLSLL